MNLKFKLLARGVRNVLLGNPHLYRDDLKDNNYNVGWIIFDGDLL